QPDNALLLMYLGRLAYGRQTLGQGKKGYLESELKEQPDNALLLMYLGRLAYGRQTLGQGKKGYLESE
ncbi:hypothetical protein B1A92_12590, partial [Neisseria meningitidis]